MSKLILIVLAVILAVSGLLFIYVWWGERSESVEAQKTAGGKTQVTDGLAELIETPDVYRFAIHKNIWGDPAIFVPRLKYVRATSDKPFTIKFGNQQTEAIMINEGFITRHMIVTSDFDEKITPWFHDGDKLDLTPFTKNRVVTDTQLPLLVKSEFDTNITVEVWAMPHSAKR